MGKVCRETGDESELNRNYPINVLGFFFCPALSPKIQYLLYCRHNSPAGVSGTSRQRVFGYYFFLLFRPEEHASSARSLLFSLSPSRLHQLLLAALTSQTSPSPKPKQRGTLDLTSLSAHAAFVFALPPLLRRPRYLPLTCACCFDGGSETRGVSRAWLPLKVGGQIKKTAQTTAANCRKW